MTESVKPKPVYQQFKPRSDITAHELAMVLETMRMQISTDLVTPAIARHFEVVP